MCSYEDNAISRTGHCVPVPICAVEDQLLIQSESPELDHSVEALDSERRGQFRHRTVMRAARISSNVHCVEALGVVRNVSESGMMIDAYRDFNIGEQITVSLLDGDRLKGEVIWKNGSSIGIQFHGSIQIDHLLAKPRLLADGTRVRPPRIMLNRKVVIRIGSIIADAELSDISQRGAKIAFAKNLAIESRAQISVGNLRPVSGSVKWQMNNLIGLEFHRTLTAEEIARWAES